MQLGKKSRYRNPSSEPCVFSKRSAHLLPSAFNQNARGEGVLQQSFSNVSFSSSVLIKRRWEKVPDRGDEGFHAEVLGEGFH